MTQMFLYFILKFTAKQSRTLFEKVKIKLHNETAFRSLFIKSPPQKIIKSISLTGWTFNKFYYYYKLDIICRRDNSRQFERPWQNSKDARDLSELHRFFLEQGHIAKTFQIWNIFFNLRINIYALFIKINSNVYVTLQVL